MSFGVVWVFYLITILLGWFSISQRQTPPPVVGPSFISTPALISLGSADTPLVPDTPSRARARTSLATVTSIPAFALAGWSRSAVPEPGEKAGTLMPSSHSSWRLPNVAPI